MEYPSTPPSPIVPLGHGHDYKMSSEALKEERSAVWTFVKRLGNNFLEGKDLVSVTMPVTICEPASFLERMTRGWVTIPYYADRMVQTEDAAERMRLAVAMVLSGLHKNLACKKPFNPYLGETYQASFEDGATLLAEQVSHHPPVSCWDVRSASGKWRFTGTAKWSGFFVGNAVKGGQKGKNLLELDDGYKVEWELPSIYVDGILTGARTLDHTGTIVFTDNSSPRLQCRLAFGDQRNLVKWVADGGKWMAGATASMVSTWFGWKDGATAAASSEVAAPDEVVGELFIASEGCGSDIRADDSKLVLSRCRGSWLVGLDWIDTKGKVMRYWSKEHTPVCPIATDPPPGVLPTDSRFRKDILALKAGDTGKAQEEKEKLENEQRALAALRKKA